MEEVKEVVYGFFVVGIIIIILLVFYQKIFQMLKSKTNTVINKLKNIWIRTLMMQAIFQVKALIF